MSASRADQDPPVHGTRRTFRWFTFEPEDGRGRLSDAGAYRMFLVTQVQQWDGTNWVPAPDWRPDPHLLAANIDTDEMLAIIAGASAQLVPESERRNP